MPALLALCDFLTGTYTVGGTSYPLGSVVNNYYTSGGPAAVDSEGLQVGHFTGYQYPQAVGPFLSEWLSLYNSSGFTCVQSYSVVTDTGNNWIAGIDSVGGPGVTNLIVSSGNKSVVTINNYTQVVSSTPMPLPSTRENAAWQVGIVECAISTNGSPVQHGGTTQTWGPSTGGIGFFYGNSNMHIQWIGIYDDTIDISWLPILSAPGAVPPSFVPSGPAPGTGPGPFHGAQPGDVVQVQCGKFSLDTVTSSNMAQGSMIQPFDVSIPGDPANNLPIAAGTWTLTTPITEMYGLWHLEGKTVMGLADGQVVGPFTVVDGSVTLPFAATNVVIGLSYTSQLQTLYLDAQGQLNMQGRRKTVPACTLRVAESRGPKIGRTFEDLQEMDELMVIPGTTPMELVTGDFRAVLFSDWEVTGQVCVQQDYPLPLTVLGIIPEFLRGDTAT